MIKLQAITYEDDGKTISYSYNHSESLSRYLSTAEPFKATYGIDLQGIPESIAVIPFIANMAPIAWFLGEDLEIDEIDSDFELSLSLIRAEMQRTNPESDLSKGKLIYTKRVKNTLQGNKAAMLFSGGVDAYTTYFRHFEETPDLITVLGADIDPDDDDQWNRLVHLNENESLLSVNAKEYVKSNMRHFYTHQVDLLCNMGWWGQIQHGLGLNGLIAPLAFKKGYSKAYIASSYTDAIKISWGSTPAIDNKICFGETQIFHDGYEMMRIDKVGYIVKRTSELGKTVDLRVCYSTYNTGINCSRCEKCLRTIMALILWNANPNDYGFKTDATFYDLVLKSFKEGFKTEGVKYFWWEILEKMKSKEPYFVFANAISEELKFNQTILALEVAQQAAIRKAPLKKLKFQIQRTFPNLFKKYLSLRYKMR